MNTVRNARDAFIGYPPAGLTKREIEVGRAWIRCETKREVAESLYITPATISTHLNRAREKYAAVGRPARTKAALVARFLQDGYIELDDL